MELGRIFGGGHRLAQAAVGEHLRKLGEDLQVLLGRLLRYEKHEGEGDGRGVGRVERNRLRQPDESAERLLQPLDASVRNRDALAEAGRTQTLALEQAVEHLAACDAVMVLEHEPRLLEKALLARGL